VQETLYTHSYLYYGVNEALDRTTEVVQVRAGAPAGSTIDHPCFNQGTVLNFTAAVTAGLATNFVGSSNYTACEAAVLALLGLDAPCLTDPKEPTSIAIGYPELEDETEAGGFGGNSAGLGAVHRNSHDVQLDLLQSLSPGVDAAGQVPYPSTNRSTCAVRGTYQAPIGAEVSFVAFSQYSFLWSFYGLDNDTATVDQLGQAGAELCGMTWSEAVAAHPGVPGGFLVNYCFTTTYAYALLKFGLRIPADEPGRVRVAPAAEDLGWALGSMFVEANSAAF